MNTIKKRFLPILMFLGIMMNTILSPVDIKAADGEYKVSVSVIYKQTEARKMLKSINKFRKSDDAWAWNETNSKKVKYKNLKNFKYDYNLEKIAMQRAAEISVTFGHVRPDGTSCFSAYGDNFEYYAYGENIAVGYTSADSVFKAWREDKEDYSGQGHRRNMLGEYNSIGIGHVVRNGMHYWVQEFGYIDEDSDEAEDRLVKTKASEASKYVKITILKEYISALQLNKKSIELKKGKKIELNDVRYLMDYAGNFGEKIKIKASYSITSEDTSVVSVSEKTLNPKKRGTTYLKIKGLGKTKKIRVTVK